MLSEKMPFACRPKTAPADPPKPVSCAPLHLTHILIVPRCAAFSPPPPGISTRCWRVPSKDNARFVIPLRSGAGAGLLTRFPLLPIDAVPLPSSGQYPTRPAGAPGPCAHTGTVAEVVRPPRLSVARAEIL